jgi:hypothetical protein
MTFTGGRDQGLLSIVEDILPPETTINYDEKNDTVNLTLPNGEKRQLNAPGISKEDLIKMSGHAVASLLGPAGIISKAPLVGGLLMTSFREAGREFGLDYLAKLAGATDQMTWGQVVASVVGGGAFDLVGRLGTKGVSALTDGVRTLISGKRPTPASLQAAKRLGVDLEDMTPTQLDRLNKLFTTASDPDAAVRAAEAEKLGIGLMEGQATQDPAQLARDLGSGAGAQRQAAQQHALEDAIGIEGVRVGGGVPRTTSEAMEAMQDSLVARRQELQNTVSEQMEIVDALEGGGPKGDLASLQRTFDNVVTNLDTRSTRKLIQKGNFPNVKQATDLMEGLFKDSEAGGGVAWGDVLATRRAIDDLDGSPKELEIIRNRILPELRKWQNEFVEKVKFEEGTAFAKGREARIALRKEFEASDVIEDLTTTNRVNGEDVLVQSPDKVKNYFFNSSKILGPKATRDNIRKLKASLSTEQFGLFAQSMHNELFDKARVLDSRTGQRRFSGAKLTDALATMKKEHGAVYDEVFNEAEKRFHTRVARVGTYIQQGPGVQTPRNRVVRDKVNTLLNALAIGIQSPKLRGAARSTLIGDAVDSTIGRVQATSVLRRDQKARLPGGGFIGAQTLPAVTEDEERANVQ